MIGGSRERGLCVLAVLLALVSSAAAKPVNWKGQVEKLSLAELVAVMEDSSNDRWPTIPFAFAGSTGELPKGYELPLALFAKIQETEWADPGFSPDKALEMSQTYLQLAVHLHKSGGYANQVLADTLRRLALARLGKFAADKPDSSAKAIEVLGKADALKATPATFAAMLTDALKASGKPTPTLQPVQPGSDAIQSASRDAEGQLDQALHPMAQEISPAYHTAALLRRPNMRLLIARVRDTEIAQLPSGPGAANPGVHGTNGEPDTLYAYAVDPAPAAGPDAPKQVSKLAETPVDITLAELDKLITSPGGGWAVPKIPKVRVVRKEMITLPQPPQPVLPPGRVAPPPKPPKQREVTHVEWVEPQAAGQPAKFMVFYNGKSSGLHQGTMSNSGLWGQLSPDGSRLMYLVENEKGVRPIIDLKEGETFVGIASDSIRFSKDGKSLIYLASRKEQHFVVWNGKAMGPYKSPPLTWMGDDGAHAAWYVVEDGSFIIDGKERAKLPVAGGQTWKVAVSPDGKHWAMQAGDSPAATHVGVAGQQPRKLERADTPLAVLNDGHVVLLSGEPTNPSINLDDKTLYAAKDVVLPPRLSADGKAVLVAGKAESAIVPLDGSTPKVIAGQAFFSDKGDQYVVGNGTGMMQMRSELDLGNGKTYKTRGEAQSGGVIFGPGGRVALWAVSSLATTQINDRRFVLDGLEGPALTANHPPVFSPDGKFLVAAVRRGLAWRISINGHESRESYERILPVTPYFEAADTCRLLAVRDGKVMEVRVKLGTPAAFNGKEPAK